MTKTSSTNKKATSPAKKATSRKVKPKKETTDAAKRAHTGVQAHGHEWEDDLNIAIDTKSFIYWVNNKAY